MSSFNQNVIKHKTGLLNLAAELGNISRACRIMGFSRDTFYRYQAARDAGGVEALFEVSRRKPNLKNRVDEMTEQAVCEFALAFPAHGQLRASNELRKKGIFVSPSGVRSIWLRNGLASMKQRLSALERKSAEEGLILTEAQVQALERKKQDDEACGEIESYHPGYLGSQDTFYVGTVKGVGRIYQQTFVDTYSRWAAAKLYTTKTPITPQTCSMIGCFLSSKSMEWESSVCSPTVALNTVAKWKATTTRCILASAESNTPRPKRAIPKPMGYASVSTRPYFRSSIRLRFAKNCTRLLKNYKVIWTAG